MKKIVFYVYNIYGIGGTVRTVINSANYLVEKNYEVEIISIRKTSAKPALNINPKVKLTRLFDIHRGFKGVKGRFIKLLMKFPTIWFDKHEELNVNGNLNLFTDLLLYRSMKKVKANYVVTTIPSLNYMSTKFVSNDIVKIGQEHSQFSVHKASLQKKILKNYNKLDILTVLTNHEKESYQKLLGSTPKIEIVPNGTPKSEFISDNENKIIISAGRFVYQKGYERLIRAYSPLVKEFPDWTLRIFGSGADFKIMQDEIAVQKAYNNIFIFPSSNEVLKEMAQSSIFVLPSRFEPFGMVVIEAMSTGIPVISYDALGPKEIISNGEDGYIIPMDDEELLREKLRKLIIDVNLRKNMGEKALDKSKLYSFENVGEIWQRKILVD